MASPTILSDGKNRDTAKCPICGGPNLCALAADPTATECWCDSVDFPIELLAQIPDDAVRKQCICQKCLAQFQDSSSVSENAS